MSFANPTALRVGARGTLHGWTVTVVGRVVLGVEVDGERYYWNEYNLADATGHTGTLVYEEGEAGPEWKLFQLLPPTAHPLTVAEAETKRVGDRVSFGGPAIPITLVDRSRVHHIEGTAPEGVEVGDLADFFNADAGDSMIVASWTGNEIEFYEGRDVPAATIASAFGLPRGAVGIRPGPAPAVAAPSPASRRNTWVVPIALGVVVAVAAGSCIFRRPLPRAFNPRPLPYKPVPVLIPATGTGGTIGRQFFTVAGHTLMDVARIGGRSERREYLLRSDDPQPTVLVNGLAGSPRQWHLMRTVPPPPGFTPYAAAAMRRGQRVSLGAVTATVNELLLAQVRTRDGQAALEAPLPDKMYGFLAAGGADTWLVRWTELELTVQRATPLAESTVLAAFTPGPEKPR